MNPLAPFFIMYCVLGLACAFGITLYVIMKLLNRSNNIGDSYGSFDDYSRTVIHMEINHDDIGLDWGRMYLKTYGETNYEDNSDMMPEALKANDDDIYGELEDVDIPLFKPLNE